MAASSSSQALRAAATGNVPAQGGHKSFPAMIDQLKVQVALALPKHLNADRMARIALTEFRKTPALGKCDPTSVFASVVVAAQLGLEPGVLGQGYLIPYKGTCTFVPGWRGLVDLVQRSGRASVWTGAVFMGDEFEYQFGTDPHISHRPSGEDDPDKLTHVYAVGRVKGAELPIIDVWPIDKVRRHLKRYNKVGESHYAYRHWEMYARKVVLLQVLKYLPATPELSRALEAEYSAADGERINLKDAIEGTWTSSTVSDDATPAAADATAGEFDAEASRALDAAQAAKEQQA